MSTPERALISWSERQRPIVQEEDLESNFALIKEIMIACGEKLLEQPFDDNAKEIPNLADFEA